MLASIARALELLLPLVPGPLVAPLAEIAGTLAYLVSSRSRAAVRANLRVIGMPRASARRAFVNQARNYIDTFRLVRLDPERVRRTVDLVGFETFTAANAKGIGVIMASAHLGPMVICGQILSAHGYAITVPVEPDRSPFDRVVNRLRQRFGARFVPTDSARGIFRVLKQGGVLGFLADRATTGVGERVRFFGKEALLPSAHVTLALRTGAPLIPAFAHRRGDRLVAHFEPPLELPRTDDRAADVREGVRRFAAVLERHIRQSPEQWAVFERVWDEVA